MITKRRLHVELQRDQNDCGVACLLTIIKYHQGIASIETLRIQCGTNLGGTTLRGLQNAAQEVGFVSNGYKGNIDFLVSLNNPCILHVVLDGNMQHYVVLFKIETGKNGRRFIIGDPSKGLINISEDELMNIWTSNVCLVLTPGDDFKLSTKVKAKKIKWLVDLLKDDYSILLLSVVLGVGIALMGLAMAVFSQKLVDNILPKKLYLNLVFGIIFLFFILFIKEALSSMKQFFLLKQAKSFNIRVVDFFYSHLLRLPSTFFDSRTIGELTARLNDTSRIQNVITQIATNVTSEFLTAIVSIIFIFVYSWQVGLISSLLMPAFFLLIWKFNRKILFGQRDIMAKYAISQSNYISTLQGIDAIKNFNKQKLFGVTNEKINEIYQESKISLGLLQIKMFFLANGFGVLFIVSVLSYTSFQVLHDHLKIGELIAILGMCGTMLPSVANLALISIPINEAKIAFDRMFEFTGNVEQTDSNNIVLNNISALELNSVAFSFPGRPKLFADISLKVAKGEIIAVMGENGCGKSTLIKIIQKHYHPQSGMILINDIPIAQLQSESILNKIGLVPQHIHIFNTTILENIAFDEAVTNTERVLKFLVEFGFDSFTNSFFNGPFTIVGEEGINLSGGQRQMIGIARALYHRPEVLILDEATAAMDRKTELSVLNLLRKLKPELAVIFITHRLHVLKTLCDRIYLIEDGKTELSGSHGHLLQTQNLYSSYWSDLG